MQISAANLLASQSQASARTPGTAAPFEPIAFKPPPQAAVRQDTARQAAPAVTPPGTHSTARANPPNAYVRPGTNVDIKI
jgi:hypothetical protein